MCLGQIAANLGLPVFPCRADKKPLPGSRGFEEASTDPPTILKLFAGEGAELIGMPTGGASGRVVIDIDPRHSGNEWWADNLPFFPETLLVGTPGGGWHAHFQNPTHVDIRNSAGTQTRGIAPGVDVRGNGGYVCIPPSPGYSVLNDAEPAEMPGWLIKLCLKPEPQVRGLPAEPPQTNGHERFDKYAQAALEGELAELRRTPEGGRNDQLNRAAFSLGTLIAAGLLSRPVVEAELTRAALDIGLTMPEIRATLRSGITAGLGHPREIPERPRRPAGEVLKFHANDDQQKASSEDDWPEPVNFLADYMTGTPVLRPDHLPEALSPFVFDTAERMGTDPAAVALSAIVALSSVISEEWALQPKQHDTEWTENARIWGAIVGDPSVLKTPVIKTATAPIDCMEAEARQQHAEEMREHKVRFKEWKDAGSDPSTEPRPPRRVRYLVESTTLEALSEVLRDDDDAKMHAPNR